MSLGIDCLGMYPLGVDPCYVAAAEVGVAADAIGGVGVRLISADVGAGSDALPGTSARVPMSDVASASDSAAVRVSIQLTDAAVAADAAALLACALRVGDSAAGMDSSAISVRLSSTDVAVSVDSATSTITALLKQVMDAAGGADTVNTIAVIAPVSDSGAAVDSLMLSVRLTAGDTATALDGLDILKHLLISVTDSASGVESHTISVVVSLADAATGADALSSLHALLAVIESAGGTDAVLSYDSGTKLATIKFTVHSRAMAFAIQQRGIKFTLH